VQTNAVYYVYDGNLVIQERDLNNQPTTTYTRGKDLSGSLEGAGGIAGLLARTSQQYADGPLAGNAFYHADANGNVTMLVNSSQAVVAKYLYDAFGNVLSASGLLANANRYQFSSKEKDLNSGLVNYLYRFYDPSFQRWLNRDPLGEQGFETTRHIAARNIAFVRLSVGAEPLIGPNLYEFIGNGPMDGTDPDGLISNACAAAQKAVASAFRAVAQGGTGALMAAMPMLNSMVALMNQICNKPPPPPPCPVTNPQPNPPMLPPVIWVPPAEECLEGLCMLAL
jgi:RHS repeat-associated protein